MKSKSPDMKKRDTEETEIRVSDTGTTIPGNRTRRTRIYIYIYISVILIDVDVDDDDDTTPAPCYE